MWLIFVFLILGIPLFIVLADFFSFLIKGQRILSLATKAMEPISLLAYPLIFAGFGKKIDCCLDDFDAPAFALDHQLTIGLLIILCLAAYFYSSYRNKTAPPLIEVLVNILLLVGIVFNVFIAIHANQILYIILGSVPIIILFVTMLMQNQQMLIEELSSQKQPAGLLQSISFKILTLKPIIKFPLLMILALPVLVIITSILLLFGQKPDSIILAFTQTYKHGFSQLDYQCNNVECGGHYLCSVAANGHKKVVKPERLGVRNGGTIVCNRQLLISNAFEDYIQENWPQLHRFIRSQYNKVGNVVHRYYSIFNNKLVADTIYVFMKPLEWFFLIVLYCVDFRPENRIARQYIARKDRQLIDEALAVNHLSTLPIKDESIH